MDTWIMIHSGSQYIGYTLAKHYNELAKEKNASWHAEVRKDLAFFPKDTEEFSNYINEMNYCIEFALQNPEYGRGNETFGRTRNSTPHTLRQ